MRSDIYWFAEICKSQCLSHFAASFIASRAEVSIVKGMLVMSKSAYIKPQQTVTEVQPVQVLVKQIAIKRLSWRFLCHQATILTTP